MAVAAEEEDLYVLVTYHYILANHRIVAMVDYYVSWVVTVVSVCRSVVRTCFVAALCRCCLYSTHRCHHAGCVVCYCRVC